MNNLASLKKTNWIKRVRRLLAHYRRLLANDKTPGCLVRRLGDPGHTPEQQTAHYTALKSKLAIGEKVRSLEFLLKDLTVGLFPPGSVGFVSETGQKMLALGHRLSSRPTRAPIIMTTRPLPRRVPRARAHRATASRPTTTSTSPPGLSDPDPEPDPELVENLTGQTAKGALHGA